MIGRPIDELKQDFVRGVLWVGGGITLLFGLELAFELYAQGFPPLDAKGFAGVMNNAKLLDALSPMARAYNNMLAMLLATIGLAIPLTANMHTPKLIDMFLRDRINRVVLTLGAVGAAHVLWVMYLVGPNFAPIWSYRLAVFGAIAGWIVVIPYFFYVVRFLDPSAIIRRLRDETERTLARVAEQKDDPSLAQDVIHDRLFQIGTIVIKALDRADRGVAHEGVWAFREIMRRYGEVKPSMGDEWFRVGRSDFVGMSHYAIQMINEKRTWMEMQVVHQLVLCYRHALMHAPGEVSTITNVNRRIAVEAARREDRHAVSLAVRVFNTFLRDSLMKNDSRAAFDIFYQYRQLAAELVTSERTVKRIGGFFVTYAKLAEELGVPSVADLAAFDLEHVVEAAFIAESGAADKLLETLLGMPNEVNGRPVGARLRAKIICAGFFLERGLSEPLERVHAHLATLPVEQLRQAVEDVVSVGKRAYWEVTDRAINIEWTSKERRAHVREFAESLYDAGTESDVSV
ncbi:MAG: DUF2254 domain-containing protein [Myxococcales bacterium]|nr:DUF2254 domain-containing protein [Myxococcales bacterium]